MLLLMTDTAWSRAVDAAGWVLAGWLALSVPVALGVGRLIAAGKGGDRAD